MVEKRDIDGRARSGGAKQPLRIQGHKYSWTSTMHGEQ